MQELNIIFYTSMITLRTKQLPSGQGPLPSSSLGQASPCPSLHHSLLLYRRGQALGIMALPIKYTLGQSSIILVSSLVHFSSVLISIVQSRNGNIMSFYQRSLKFLMITKKYVGTVVLDSFVSYQIFSQIFLISNENYFCATDFSYIK